MTQEDIRKAVEALTPLTPLSQRERERDKKEASVFLPSLPLGEGGRGGEGFGGHNAVAPSSVGKGSDSAITSGSRSRRDALAKLRVTCERIACPLLVPE
jgi:hypothetical protein